MAILLMLAGYWSCIPQDGPAGRGNVSMVFQTTPETRTVTPGTEAAAEGGAIARRTTNADEPDLWIFIVSDDDHELKARYPGMSLATDGTLKEHFTERADTVVFHSMEAGAYTVYAIANTEGLGYTTALNSIPTAAADDALETLCFTLLSGTDTVALGPVGSKRLPLAAKAPLEVTNGNNGVVHLEMLRCLSKISVEFVNQTSGALDLRNGDQLSITLHNMNPNQGFVFPHDPDIPSGAYDSRDLTFSAASNITQGDTLRLSKLVFPCDVEHCGAFTCDVSFTETIDAAQQNHSYSNLPILDNRAREIQQLARNQHLHIVIRVSRSKWVSFNFEVSDWDSKTETVDFY